VMDTTIALATVNSQLLMVTVDSQHDAGHTGTYLVNSRPR
jgi:hypothetical protein